MKRATPKDMLALLPVEHFDSPAELRWQRDTWKMWATAGWGAALCFLICLLIVISMLP